jgi:SAM-dependent methyltransferase
MTKPAQGSHYWDERFQITDYAYGEAPNDFLVWAAPQLRVGRALSLCEGEGRNAVYLAQLGFEVTAVDFSAVGLHKAQALAARHGVTIHCELLDLKDLVLQAQAWDLIVSVFAQPAARVRKCLNASLAGSLKPGGAFVLESKVSEETDALSRYPDVNQLQQEISPLRVAFAHQGLRDLREGSYHRGMHHTAQILAYQN